MNSHEVGWLRPMWVETLSFTPISPDVNQTQEIGVLGHLCMVCCLFLPGVGADLNIDSPSF